jgi:hypothetical protein
MSLYCQPSSACSTQQSYSTWARAIACAALVPPPLESGAREWNWDETGTRHDPGIQPGDVQELLDNGATTVILSKGVHERLKTHPATLDMLRQRGITVQVLQTEVAIEAYNALVDAEPVGALIHSTC